MSTPQPENHVVVTASVGSRLEELAEAYAQAKPAADAANARLDEITLKLKLALNEAAPGATKVDFDAPVLDAPLRLTSQSSWRLDSTWLKREQPETWVRYAKQTSTWVLRAGKRDAS